MKNGGGGKLLVIGLFIGILLTGTLSFGYIKYSHRQSLIKQIHMQAWMISNSAITGLMYQNTEDVTYKLCTLEADKAVVFGGVYDGEDNLFASYYRKGIIPESLQTARPAKTGYFFDDKYLKLSEPILLDSEKIGTICIYSEL